MPGSQGTSYLITTGMSLRASRPWHLIHLGRDWLKVDRYVQGKAVRGSGGLAAGSAPLRAWGVVVRWVFYRHWHHAFHQKPLLPSLPSQSLEPPS